MRVRIIFRPRERVEESTLFGDVFVQPHSSFLPVSASAAAHALAILLLPTALQFFSTYDPPPEHKTYHLEMLHLQVPDRIFLPAPQAGAERPAKAENRAPAKPAPAPAAATASGVQGKSSPSPAPRQMELPVTRRASEQAPVILQPDTALPQAPSVPPAPNMAFWNKALQPPPPRKQAVIPGRVQEAAKPPNLEAPPVLSPSTPQAMTSDVAAMLAPTQATPKLALPNASTNPIRMHGKDGNEIASFDMPQSDPVDLIYLMADRPAPKQIEIPKGLQNAPRSRSGNGTQGPAPSSSSLGAGDHPNANAASNSAANRPGPGKDAAGASPSAGSAVHAASQNTTAAAAPTQTAHDSAAEAAARANASKSAGATPAGATANAASRATAAETNRSPEAPAGNDAGVIRVNHPVNGNFDVVILQSAAREDLPAVGTTLSGNPVYTVYLNVGDKREWLLEYCVPSSGNQRASAYQVNIDDSGVVSAPYPVATAIPGKVLDLAHTKHIALHGILSAAGVFRNVTAPDMEDPLVREVLPLLAQWKFRPALRDKVPVEVEVLLIIPARS